MGRKRKDYGEVDPSGNIKCAGCGNLVKRTSIHAHLKTEEHKALSEIRAMRAKGWEKLALDDTAASLLPNGEGSVLLRERAVSSYHRGGWGKSATVRRSWYAPVGMSQMIIATLATEPLGYTTTPYAKARIQSFLHTIFRDSETFSICSMMYESICGQRLDRETAREWSNRVSDTFDAPRLLTDKQRSDENDNWLREERDRASREAEEHRAKQIEDARMRRVEAERAQRHLSAVAELAAALRRVAPSITDETEKLAVLRILEKVYDA